MLTPAEYDDVIVTVAHPYADIETTLRQWIETGPGPRPFVTITAICTGLSGLCMPPHSKSELPRFGRIASLDTLHRWRPKAEVWAAMISRLSAVVVIGIGRLSTVT